MFFNMIILFGVMEGGLPIRLLPDPRQPIREVVIYDSQITRRRHFTTDPTDKTPPG